MGKTKDLALEEQERQSIDPKQNLEVTKPAPKVAKMIAISTVLHQQIIDYLEEKPYGEVKDIINSLSQAHVIDVTFN
jgi:hypothetical protein